MGDIVQKCWTEKCCGVKSLLSFFFHASEFFSPFAVHEAPQSTFCLYAGFLDLHIIRWDEQELWLKWKKKTLLGGDYELWSPKELQAKGGF